MTYPGSSWTDERVEMLRDLCAKGLSAGQMAEELGGISRNAVISKIHRSGMIFGLISVGGRPKSGPKPRTHPFVPRKSKTPEKPRIYDAVPGLHAVDLPPEPVANPVTLMQLNDATCRWPVDGDGATTMFCGAGVVSGFPYCAGHARMAYARPMTPAEREAAMRGPRRLAK